MLLARYIRMRVRWTRAAPRAVVETYEPRYHEPMLRLHVQATQLRFDWESGRLAPPTPVNHGIVDVATIAAR
jgi:hypothetical protein